VILQLINEIAKKIVNDYCVKNDNHRKHIHSDTMINVMKTYNNTLPKYKKDIKKKIY
jgi:hypothetical protein